MTSTIQQPLDLLGAEDSAFTAYCQAVTRFCPFLRPAAEAKALFTATIRIKDELIEDVHARIFENLIPQVEAFRVDRRQSRDKRRELLLCYNVILDVPKSLEGYGKELLAWPCWLAKQIYTGQGILFGFFWKSERDTARSGGPLPVPPVNFISIRSKIANLDRRFFTKNPDLLQPHVDGWDDGRNVHAELFGDHVPDLADVNSIHNAAYYAGVSAWGESLLKKTNLSSRVESE